MSICKVVISTLKGRTLLSALPPRGQIYTEYIVGHVTSHNCCYPDGNAAKDWCTGSVCAILVHHTHSLCNAEYSNATAQVALLMSSMWGMCHLPRVDAHTHTQTKHTHKPLCSFSHMSRFVPLISGKSASWLAPGTPPALLQQVWTGVSERVTAEFYITPHSRGRRGLGWLNSCLAWVNGPCKLTDPVKEVLGKEYRTPSYGLGQRGRSSEQMALASNGKPHRRDAEIKQCGLRILGQVWEKGRNEVLRWENWCYNTLNDPVHHPSSSLNKKGTVWE